MPIIKNRKKERPFVILDRTSIQDERLSWRARGLLHYLLSLPCDWVVSISDLANRAPDGKDAVYSTIKELRQAGYIRYERVRHADGTLAGSAYYVFEVPEDLPDDSDVSFSANIIESEGKENPSALPDGKNPNWREPNQVKPDTYIINNIHNKQNTKKTAAAALFSNKQEFSKTGENSHQDSNVETYQFADKNIAFTFDDVLITDKLTPYQQMRVNDLAAHLVHHAPYLNAKEFAKQIAETLISHQHFLRCGRDFHRKLNAIQKTILSGGWTPPIESAERALQEKQKKLQQHKKNLDAAIDELTHWQKMLDFALTNHKQTEVTYFEMLIQKSKEKIRIIQNEFQQQEEEDANI